MRTFYLQGLTLALPSNAEDVKVPIPAGAVLQLDEAAEGQVWGRLILANATQADEVALAAVFAPKLVPAPPAGA